MDGVKYEIEQHGDSFVLFSLVQTNLGGVTKSYVRRAQTAGELAATIRRLQNEHEKVRLVQFCSMLTNYRNYLWSFKRSMGMKWAIQVPFDGSWLFLVQYTEDGERLTPVLFDTHQAAEDFASIYKHHKIVEYICK